MTYFETPLTRTAIGAEADRLLVNAGFQPVMLPLAGMWKATGARVYEDAYSIVCVAVYDTWEQLSSGWIDDQANLVDLISSYFTRYDAKAWDGYLVLFTPSVVPQPERRSAIAIQRDTIRVRKLFADGSELWSTNAIQRTLLPVLPLDEHEALEERDVLGALPQLLVKYGIKEEATRIAIEAFRAQRPIIEEIHAAMTKRQGNEP